MRASQDLVETYNLISHLSPSSPLCNNMSSPSSSAVPALPTNRKLPRVNKRTVSLAPSLSSLTRPDRSQKIRNGTFIIPSTRERVKRQFSLRNPANFDGTSFSRSPLIDTDEESPLLRRRQSAAGDFWLAVENTKDFSIWAWKWLNSPLGRGVLKCSLAYLLASMATYLGPISNWLGVQDGKHVVATTVVYFHPARSAGSMFEADIYGVLAFLYFLFISVSSMAVSVLCESQLDFIELGYILVLVVFCGGGLGEYSSYR